MQPIFITGIGTGVGKTLVSAIVAEALGAYYWKPVQAGFDEGTDAEWVGARIGSGRVLPELYKLKKPASPHIAAREEGIVISLDRIAERLPSLRPLVVEGALADRDDLKASVATVLVILVGEASGLLASIGLGLVETRLKVCADGGIAVDAFPFSDAVNWVGHGLSSPPIGR